MRFAFFKKIKLKLNAIKGQHISTEDFINNVLGNSEWKILDVRKNEEIYGEHFTIENSINLPLEEIEKIDLVILEKKNTKIAVICRSGQRSTEAMKYLISRGYNAYNVLGGLIEYYEIKNRRENATVQNIKRQAI